VSAEPSLLKSLDYSVLQQCMHCGLCLPTCPTYLETGRERNSPRGRISLMRAIADGELGTTKGFADEMAYCLGLPRVHDGVPRRRRLRHALSRPARAEAERSGVKSGVLRSFIRWYTLRFLLFRPWALRCGGASGGSMSRAGCSGSALVRILSLLPRRIGELERQAIPMRPEFSDEIIAEVERPRGAARHRVAVLTGCIQDIAFSDVNRATVDVLLANGCEVTTPGAVLLRIPARPQRRSRRRPPARPAPD
jgi:glycolate oxidase iron-sulfur subunit